MLIFRTKKSDNCLSLLCASPSVLCLLDILHTKAFRSSGYPTQHHVKLRLRLERAFSHDVIHPNI